ncbi:DUF5522 domain-containing protein [Halobacteriovorax sp. GFR7]|uniref:DUF5522 domain-containing protein n=1 Tax=unclassified Halobacteriovorax TaxID=2639665 RepID=UPI00371E5707
MTNSHDDSKKDFYINEDGNTVFTKEFHLRRGYCCESGCLHCPFGFNEKDDDDSSSIPLELRKQDLKEEVSDEDLAEYYLKDFE